MSTEENVATEEKKPSTPPAEAKAEERKPEEPKKAADTGGFLSSVFASGKKDAPAAKADPKDAWKEKFETKEIETGLAAVDRVEIVKGLTAGMEVAVEDPTRPKEKKGNE